MEEVLLVTEVAVAVEAEVALVESGRSVEDIKPLEFKVLFSRWDAEDDTTVDDGPVSVLDELDEEDDDG